MRRIRALVFDDDDSIRALLLEILRARGYEALGYAEPLHCPVYDRAACSCGAHQTCGDIVITDVEMPRVSGLDLIQQQQDRGCKMDPRNVGVMSGSWGDEGLERARELRCRVFEKPFKIRELQAWLDGCEARCRTDSSLRDLGG